MLFLVSSFAFSSIVLEEEEWNQIQNYITQSQITLDNLENQSNQLKMQLHTSNQKLIEAEKNLERLKTSLNESMNEMSGLRNEVGFWKTTAIVVGCFAVGGFVYGIVIRGIR